MRFTDNTTKESIKTPKGYVKVLGNLASNYDVKIMGLFGVIDCAWRQYGCAFVKFKKVTILYEEDYSAHYSNEFCTKSFIDHTMVWTYNEFLHFEKLTKEEILELIDDFTTVVKLKLYKGL